MAHIPDDLLLGVVARRLDLVSPEGLKRAVEKLAADPTRTLGAILGEMGLMAEEVRRALAELIKSLRGRVGESLLSEVRDLNSSRQVATTQPEKEINSLPRALRHHLTAAMAVVIASHFCDFHCERLV
jgi:hypothetical protein